MVRIKVSGITSLEEARRAAEAGAALLGFSFVHRDPRRVTTQEAASIIAALRNTLRDKAPTMVGVVMDEAVAKVQALRDEARLDAVQLHGSEPPVEVRQLLPRAYKTIRPQNRGDAEATLATYAAALPSDEELPQLLVESYQPWTMAASRKEVPLGVASAIAARYRILLGGSFTAQSIAEAIARVAPWGIDLTLGDPTMADDPTWSLLAALHSHT